jgi:two-component system, OmpR family, sensor kinase
MRFNSLRNRLVLLIFAITAAAVGFVYLYVVPQLESSLTAEKLQRLETQSGELAPVLERALAERRTQSEVTDLVRQIAQRTDSRVTLLGVDPGSTPPKPSFVIADSEAEPTAILPSYDPAVRALATDRPANGVEHVAGQRVGESAVPITDGGAPQWVSVLSSPLDEVRDNVALIKRQILIAGGIALAMALLAGFYAARALSRRLGRLRQAAEQVAEGDFTQEIPIDSADEIGQLALTFNEMQQRLARLDDARKEFIANASHELRTPIFSLGGFVELLEHEDPGPKKRKEFIKTMSEQVSRLEKLTTDLLDLSRLDAEEMEMHLESVDLVELARAITAEFRPLARRRRHKLELRLADKPVLARCDPDRAAQILRILLDNALIHTPRGTKVTVTATRSAKGAELVVGDEGRGLDRRSLERVFDRFYSGDSSGGTGLGLSIADELAARMEGEVEAVSKRGYTAFTLRLPAAPKKKTKAAAGAKG